MYNCAIIGCGRIAGGYNNNPLTEGILTHAKAYTTHKETKIVACADIDLEKAKKFADRWNIPSFYEDYNDMLEQESIDLLSICTDIDSHYRVFDDCMSYGDLGAILIEKPIASNVHQAEEMVKIVSQRKIVVNINYLRRFDDNHIVVKKMIDSGILGEVRHVNVYYSGSLLNSGCHVVNLLKYFFPKGNIRKTITNLSDKYYSILEFDILGTKARIQIKDSGNDISIFEVGEDKQYPSYNIFYESKMKFKSTLNSAIYNYLQNTIDVVDGRCLPTCPIEEGAEDLKLLEEMKND